MKGPDGPRMKLNKKQISKLEEKQKSYPLMVRFWSLSWWDKRAPITNRTGLDQALMVLGKAPNMHFAYM